MRWAAGVAALALAVLAPPAAGKGLELALSADPPSPRVGQQVEIALRGVPEQPLTQPCRDMRVIVVAPGTPVRRALRSLEGGAESRRIGRWAAFRLASLRSTGELRWTGRLRPNRPGNWTLAVPNWCAKGYVLPEGVERLELNVRPAERRRLALASVIPASPITSKASPATNSAGGRDAGPDRQLPATAGRRAGGAGGNDQPLDRWTASGAAGVSRCL